VDFRSGREFTLEGEEAVSSMPEEEYRSLLIEYMIATDMTELLCAGYASKNGREIDRFNMAKDMLVDAFSAVVLAITTLFPSTSPLVIALGATEGAVAVADGILRVSQGDTVEGVFEATMGAIGTGAILSSVVTQFVKENKPKYSPDIKKWFDNGGIIEIQNIDGKQIWTYTSSVGDSVPYIDGYIKFPDEYLNPTIKSVDIGEFTGDRGKDIDKMLSILEEDYGITEIPEGYIVHHDIENGILQLVDEKIHTEFTHIGGHSIYK